jgi:hypothetical protein
MCLCRRWVTAEIGIHPGAPALPRFNEILNADDIDYAIVEPNTFLQDDSTRFLSRTTRPFRIQCLRRRMLPFIIWLIFCARRSRDPNFLNLGYSGTVYLHFSFEREKRRNSFPEQRDLRATPELSLLSHHAAINTPCII